VGNQSQVNLTANSKIFRIPIALLDHWYVENRTSLNLNGGVACVRQKQKNQIFQFPQLHAYLI